MDKHDKNKYNLNKRLSSGIRYMARKYFKAGYTSKQEIPIFNEVKEYVVNDKHDIKKELPYEKELFPYLLHVTLIPTVFRTIPSERLLYVDRSKEIFLVEVRRLEFNLKHKIKTPTKGRKSRIVDLEKRKSAPSYKISNRQIKRFSTSIGIIKSQLERLLEEELINVSKETNRHIIKSFLYSVRYSINNKCKNRKGLKHRR